MLNAVGHAQSILLLGGTSDMGLAIVEEFLSRGSASVTLAARKNSKDLPAAIDRMKKAGPRADRGHLVRRR